MGLLVDDIHANIFSSLVISMSGHGSLVLPPAFVLSSSCTFLQELASSF